MKKVHFIAIGGSAMHNLALALHHKGLQVTGSDDEIFEPSRGRLQAKGLLPEKEGWFPEKINNSLDFVIVGMHARADNPELLKAKEIGLKIFSYPEYLYEHAKEKKRIVIGGSHGKTTTTAMILHVLNSMNIKTDYMVGAQLEGFDTMVSLSDDAEFMVLEGDEYLTSPIDRRPKFHLYQPHTAVLTGIAWDHINVFPTFDIYLSQFERFINLIEENGKLIYCKKDEHLPQLVQSSNRNLTFIGYDLPKYHQKDEQLLIEHQSKLYPLNIFGEHNLLNLQAAKEVCNDLGISDTAFFESIQSFKGASGRLTMLISNKDYMVYRDFAHAPSKVKATVKAVKSKHPDKHLVALLELHTFSSLNKAFLPTYKNAMNLADERIVFYSPHTLEMKKLPFISPEEIKKYFEDSQLTVITHAEDLKTHISSIDTSQKVFLLMSSGNFQGVFSNKEIFEEQ